MRSSPQLFSLLLRANDVKTTLRKTQRYFNLRLYCKPFVRICNKKLISFFSVSDLIFWHWEKPKEVSTQRRRDSEKTDINTDNNHLGPGFMLSFYWVLCKD